MTLARHDLVFAGKGYFKLQWDAAYDGLATSFTPTSIANALNYRKTLLSLNPNLVALLEIRKQNAYETDTYQYLPPDHPWWKRDASGNRIISSQDPYTGAKYYGRFPCP